MASLRFQLWFLAAVISPLPTKSTMKGGIARFSNRAPPEAASVPAEEGKEEPLVEPQPDLLDGGFDLNDFGAGEQNDGEVGVFFMAEGAEDGAPGGGGSLGVFESVDPQESRSKDPSAVTTTTSNKGQVSQEAASQPIIRHTSTAATAAAAALGGNIAVRFLSHQPFLFCNNVFGEPGRRASSASNAENSRIARNFQVLQASCCSDSFQ